jgi:putative ABC transport system permease protein
MVYMDLAAFQRLSGDEQWSGVRFFMRDRGGDVEARVRRLRAEILACCGREYGLEMVSGGSLRREILVIFDETFAITIVLLVISLLVAGLGITTTLTVLVLERIRLLNTMVAVGASAWQIRFMIFWEAVLMVLVGEALGLACGFFLSYLLIFVINRVSFGWTFLYRLDAGALALSLPLILATALIAALPATWIALKSPPALVLKET